MTGIPSRNTRISITGLVLLGFAAMTVLFYNIDKWLVSGAAVKHVAETCAGFGTGCKDAYTSIAQILGSPQHLLISLAITALAVAFVKALFVLFSARRLTARFDMAGREFPRLQSVLAALNAEDVKVRVADDEHVTAFTHGVLAPSICLSRGLIDGLNDSELTALIAHEIGHIRRRDNLAIFVALFVRDFLWPLPISHYLLKIFVREKEYAADDFAIRLTRQPVELAEAIVSVARVSQRNVPFSPAYATFFSGKATVKDRVERLLDSGKRPQPSALQLVLSLVISALIVLAVAGFAYAQPSIDKQAIGSCGMGRECVERSHKCFK